MAVLLALVSALAYGLSDFVGGVASKKVTPWSVALSAQLAGALGVLLLSLTLDGSPTGHDLAWAMVGGLGNDTFLFGNQFTLAGGIGKIDGGGGVTGWNDASETFNVTLELVRRGYTEEAIAKLWGGNLLRVWRENERIARELQAAQTVAAR